MNLTEVVSFFLWLLVGLLGFMYICFYLSFLFFALLKITRDERVIKRKYKNELEDFDFFLISKTIRKIDLRVHYVIGNVLAIFPIITVIIVYFIMSISRNTPEGELKIEYIWPAILTLILIVVLYNVILYISNLILIRKKLYNEVGDEELLRSFNLFINDWTKKYGTKKIPFETMSNRKKTNIIFNKVQVKLKPLLKKYKKRHPKTYEFWYIERFRTYLDAIDRFILSFDYPNSNKSPIHLTSTNNYVDLDKLRFLVIHNYICDVFSINNSL